MGRRLTILMLLLFSVILCGCTNRRKELVPNESNSIKVGVFKGYGGAAVCIREAYAACLIDPGMEVTYITPDDISRGSLQGLDAFIIPGGSGSRQYMDMGESNRETLKKWVKEGGTVFGICAGAYMLSNTPEYACMNMIGAKAIDIEHDNRRHGICKVTLTPEGKKTFPEVADRDTLYLMYYEGPALVNADEADAPRYNILGTMMSDVHIEGNAPANMTGNKPFFTHTRYGKGHVIGSVGHPEATPGMQWMVPRLLRAAMEAELIAYNDVSVDPDKFNKEILCTEDVAVREKEIFMLLQKEATSKEKIEAIEYLFSVCSWDGKNWVRGMLYEQNPSVQLAAARYMNHSGYTAFFDDMKEAVRIQKDPVVQQKLQKQCDSLLLQIRGKSW